MSEDASESRLTPREEEILGLIAEGLTYWQVADMLGIASGVMRKHVQTIKKKLQLGRRSELARWYASERRAVGETVRLIQIAAILGVTHQRASVLVHLPGFPAPVGREGQSPVWDRRDVTAWVKE